MPADSETDLRSPRSILPKVDKEVLELGVRWVSYGGAGREDIFITFGWSEIQYFERLKVLVVQHVVTNELLRRRLLNVCDRRLLTAGAEP